MRMWTREFDNENLIIYITIITLIFYMNYLFDYENPKGINVCLFKNC